MINALVWSQVFEPALATTRPTTAHPPTSSSVRPGLAPAKTDRQTDMPLLCADRCVATNRVPKDVHFGHARLCERQPDGRKHQLWQVDALCMLYAEAYDVKE